MSTEFTTIIRTGFLLLLVITEIASVAAETDNSDYFSSLSDFRVSGEEVVIVRTTTSRLGSRSLESHRQHQLKFEAFNQTYDLTLQPSVGLISPHFSVIVRDRNTTQTIQSQPFTRCFYRGQEAAFDLCRGMRGIVTLSPTEFLSVEPLRQRKRSMDDSENNHHLVRRMSWSPNWLRVAANEKKKKRVRRNVNSERGSGITIETAVFVDAYLYSHMARTSFPDDTEQEMTHFVLAMINAVQLLYQDGSLNREIEFQVQRLEMWTRQPLDLLPNLASASSASTTTTSNKASINDIDRYLNRFCHWQNRENPVGDQDPDHWDHALLLTGLDLFAVGRDGFTTHQIVGLAPIGGMCTSTSSCTVNEGRHFEAVYVVAHEIGHNLGMKHDGREAGNDCDSGSFVMSPTLGSGKTQWSPCSKHYLDAFLNTMQASCLRDRSWISERLNHNASGSLPGERFTADQQCILRYGKESRRIAQRTLNEICRDLRCTNVPTRTTRQIGTGLLSYASHPALEGTECGDNMWCRRGRCSPKARLQQYENDPNQWNGDHGELPTWSIISPCASGCLYGLHSLSSGSMAISTSVQNCRNNLPCSDISLRYQTCDGSQLCNNVTRTTVQQYTDDVCYQAAQQNSTILPKGIQQLSVDAFRSCQVWCYVRSGGLMTASGWIYPDGTRCQTLYNTNQYSRNADGFKMTTLCLSGRCQEFSCDPRSTHQLNAAVCRSEEPSETNTIYDYSYPHQKVMAFKYTEKNYNPIRAGYPQSFKLFAPIPVYTPPSTNGYSSQPSKFSVPKDSSYYPPQQIENDSKSVSGWGPWKPVSSCRSGCLTSSKGLRLVQRNCESGTCDGPVRSVQLCIPNEEECPQYHTVSSFADRVCREQHWSGLHRGVQTWSATTELSVDACVVHCRVPRSEELVPAASDKGWFPSGTLCDLRKPAYYCLSGRCVEFNEEGIPN